MQSTNRSLIWPRNRPVAQIFCQSDTHKHSLTHVPTQSRTDLFNESLDHCINKSVIQLIQWTFKLVFTHLSILTQYNHPRNFFRLVAFLQVYPQSPGIANKHFCFRRIFANSYPNMCNKSRSLKLFKLNLDNMITDMIARLAIKSTSQSFIYLIKQSFSSTYYFYVNHLFAQSADRNLWSHSVFVGMSSILPGRWRKWKRTNNTTMAGHYLHSFIRNNVQPKEAISDKKVFSFFFFWQLFYKIWDKLAGNNFFDDSFI